MKIYVITKGCYSDYHICAVATDPEKAKKLAEIYTDRYDNAEVEEFDTDNTIDLLSGRLPYSVVFSGTGVVVGGPALEAEYTKDFAPGVNVWGAQLWWPTERLQVKVYAPDKETAVKIAAEKRAEFLAQRAGL